MDSLVEMARRKVRLNASINGLRVMLIKPQIQFVQLLGRERVYRAFNLLDRVQVHGRPLRCFGGQDYHEDQGRFNGAYGYHPFSG
jgi:hypothetical protein